MLAACILFLIVLKIVIKILLITNKIKHTVSGLSQKKKLIYKTILTYEDLILQRS